MTRGRNQLTELFYRSTGGIKDLPLNITTPLIPGIVFEKERLNLNKPVRTIGSAPAPSVTSSPTTGPILADPSTGLHETPVVAHEMDTPATTSPTASKDLPESKVSEEVVTMKTQGEIDKDKRQNFIKISIFVALAALAVFAIYKYSKSTDAA